MAVQDVGTTTASGTLATGVSWSLSDNGNLQFSGSGAIEKDDGQDNYPWDMTQVVTVTIQSGITGIGSGALQMGRNLRKFSSVRTVCGQSVQMHLKTVQMRGKPLLFRKCTDSNSCIYRDIESIY